MIQVIVSTEPGATTFNIHKDLLTYHCEYFRTALKECWKPGADDTIHLPDEDAYIFSLFNYWMYTKRLYHKEHCIDNKSAVIETIPLSFKHLFDTYVFADKRGIPELANDVIDTIFAQICQHRCIPDWELEYIYVNTPQGSALRRYVVDFALATEKFDDIDEIADIYPKEFLVEVISAASKGNINIVGNKKPWEAYITEAKELFCKKYHDHSTTTKKKKT
jgi:hypothetical protein